MQKKLYLCTAFADMAQLVEQRIRNAWVGGSSPPIGSKAFPILFLHLSKYPIHHPVYACGTDAIRCAYTVPLKVFHDFSD